MVLADVVDAADVAVRHLARDAHLVVELGEPLRILGDGRRQELQRDALSEAQILGAVDLAHAAAADQAEDAVALGEQRARGERFAGGPGADDDSQPGRERRARGWVRRLRAAARLQAGLGQVRFRPRRRHQRILLMWMAIARLV